MHSWRRYAEAAPTRCQRSRDHPRDRRGGRGRSGRIVQDGASDASADGPDRHQQRRRPADRARHPGRPHIPRCRAAQRRSPPMRPRSSTGAALSIREQPLALAIDPLDGSSNVNLNLSFGTIFSILPSLQPQSEPLRELPAARRQPARRRLHRLRAAAVAGAQRRRGHAHLRIQRPDRRLPPRRANVRVPPQAKEFAINASNYRHWDEFGAALFRRLREGRARAARARLQHALARLAGRRGLPHPACAAACSSIRPTSAPGYGNGRLRLVYEANPVAFLMEQAGRQRHRRRRPRSCRSTPESLHQRTPLIFGSGREVAKLTRYHTDPSADRRALAALRPARPVPDLSRCRSSTPSSRSPARRAAARPRCGAPSSRSSAARRSTPSSSRATPSTATTAQACSDCQAAAAARTATSTSAISARRTTFSRSWSRPSPNTAATGTGALATTSTTRKRRELYGAPPGTFTEWEDVPAPAPTSSSTKGCTAPSSPTRSTSPRMPT